MSMPYPAPGAAFTGSLFDAATGTWVPAQATVTQGFVILSSASPTGWVQRFSVPATQVAVKSAAQRITLLVAGQSFVILADPGAVDRAIALNAGHILGGVAGAAGHGLSAATTVGRGVNQAAAAQAFHAGGGPGFLAAARASGARVSRLGYGPIIALGCGGGLVVAIAVLVLTTLVLNL